MKFKHHVGVHYGRLTRRFGPLSHIKVIRLEGKHRIMKSYTKNTNNRRNMSYSLARKVQYNTALRLWKAEGFQDQIKALKPKKIWLKDQVELLLTLIALPVELRVNIFKGILPEAIIVSTSISIIGTRIFFYKKGDYQWYHIFNKTVATRLF